MEGKGGLRGREEGNGEGREKGEVGGMAPWSLGDRRPCKYSQLSISQAASYHRQQVKLQ